MLFQFDHLSLQGGAETFYGGLIASGWHSTRVVPIDAIPNVGENQVIVFTEWPGRSPKDVEDQITYPLSVALLSVMDPPPSLRIRQW